MKEKIINLLKKYYWLLLVVILLIFTAKYISNQSRIMVQNSIPTNNSRRVSVKSEIVFIFNKDVNSKKQSQINILFSPKVQFDYFWTNNQLRVVPQKSLNPKTLYKIGVVYKNKKLYELSFETEEVPNEETLQEGCLQSTDDLDFGKTFKKFTEEYPWYLSLPIETREYRIVYDFKEKSFRIRIIKETSSENEKLIIEKSLENLKNIGVKEPIPYYVVKGE